MPRVTVETVDHVARLARLSLTEDERALFARQLDDILAWAEALQAVDVAGVEPLAAPGAGELRADETRDGLSQETALSGAPDAAEGLFRVPRVIGG
jgi:aspartyl-tRNA(Asn)/glutamyl-tRNA(Gln) amidotransferase subunit C